MGNGCGSVGRAVAYDTRGPHAVINLINLPMHWKYGKKEKRQNMGNGCSSVGKVAAYDTSSIQFQSSQWQIL